MLFRSALSRVSRHTATSANATSVVVARCMSSGVQSVPDELKPFYALGEWVSQWVRERVCVCVCVWVSEWVSEWVSGWVYVYTCLSK
jgi:hypothetical protein